MRPWFRAIAVDYDGTLCLGDTPGPDVLGAIAEARRAGIRTVLVTGRIEAELGAVFPEVGEHFDALVLENGGVLSMEGRSEPLAPCAPAGLFEALAARGVPVRRGEVLIATQTIHDRRVLDAIHQLGIDCHLVYNRGELMVLPPEVSKGTGLAAALAALGLSPHDCIAFGDAENDHALLDTVEIGVAVGNAIGSLRERADVVLDQPAGLGVASFLRAQLAASAPIRPSRWQLELGWYEDGSPVRIPGSGVSVLIEGGSGSGKSFVAGLLAERVLDLGYTLCVIDPEGDHAQLAERPGVLRLGAHRRLADSELVIELIRSQMGSIVVDLSLEAETNRARYCRNLLRALLQLRERTGRPHWILVDEAHVAMGVGFSERVPLVPFPTGLCLVTWRPDWLCREAASGPEIVVEVEGRERVSIRRGDEPPRGFVLNERRHAHVRHWHKYVHGETPRELRFWFRNAAGTTGRSAGNLHELHQEIRSAPGAVIAHHAAHRDFSRWVEQVFRDPVLAADLEGVESSERTLPDVRSALLSAIELRYPGTPVPPERRDEG